MKRLETRNQGKYAQYKIRNGKNAGKYTNFHIWEDIGEMAKDISKRGRMKENFIDTENGRRLFAEDTTVATNNISGIYEN